MAYKPLSTSARLPSRAQAEVSTLVTGMQLHDRIVCTPNLSNLSTVTVVFLRLFVL